MKAQRRNHAAPNIPYAAPMRRAFLLALLLTACSPRHTATLRAQVRGWQGGAGQVTALDDQQRAVSSAALDPAGRFNLPLPSDKELEGRLSTSPAGLKPPAGCGPSPSSAAPLFVIRTLRARGEDGRAFTLVSRDDAADQSRRDEHLLIYAAAPAQLRADVRCGAQTFSYRLNLRAGWNYALLRQTPNLSTFESSGKDGLEGWTAL